MAIRPLDYYLERGIIPTHQANTPAHHRRRERLFERLGLPKFAFRGASVIEFGPGSCDNARVLAGWDIRNLHLVDANPASIDAATELASKMPNVITVEHSEITKAQLGHDYDIAICEGVIPGQPNPAEVLECVSDFVDVDGVLVITCQSPLGLLSEICRRQFKHVFVERYGEDGLEDRLVGFFRPDVEYLTGLGMSRSARDWVQDQIMCPWSNPIFTVPEAIDALQGHFEVLHVASPQFMQDFSWYKTEPDRDSRTVEDYYTTMPIMLDCEINILDRSLSYEGGVHLEKLAKRVVDHHVSHPGDMKTFLDLLRDLSAAFMLIDSRPYKTIGLDNFLCDMPRFLNGEEPSFTHFHHWFGRGQQYISFIRR